MKTTFLTAALLLGSSYFTIATEFRSSGKVKHNLTAKRTGLPTGSIAILIDKSDYELYVYDEEGWYATYPVVFGNSSLKDKVMEGDKNTPEGEFSIVSKRIDNKWDRFMMLDYPNKESWSKFNRRKAKGEIPKTASIGGGIGIHGTWPNEDYQIDRYNNWTDGCISMKNKDVEDLYSYLPVGTRITIRK